MTFPRVLAESGLTKPELGRLYGVSRQTIHFWAKRGRAASPADGYTGRMATTITAALVVALNRRLLPLGAISAEARRERITQMAARLQNAKPAPAGK